MHNDDSRLPPGRLPLTGRTWFTIFVLVAALSLTAAAAAIFLSKVKQADANRLAASVDVVGSRMIQRFDSYTAMLRGAAGLVVAQGDIDRQAFRVYVEQLNLRERYLGIQGIGWSVRVPAGDENPLIAWYHAQGFPQVQFWPATARPDRQAIALIEPLSAINLSRLGFDMTSQPDQKMAMELACIQNRVIATGPMALSVRLNGHLADNQTVEQQNPRGFLVYIPVYEGIIPVDHLTRNDALRGFVYAEFRSDLLLNDVLNQEEAERLSFALSDAGPVDEGNIALDHPDLDSLGNVMAVKKETEKNSLYQSAIHPIQLPNAWYSATRIFSVAGRNWVINACSTPAFERESSRQVVVWFFGIGIVLSFGLFLLSRSHARNVIANTKLYFKSIDGQRAAEINLSISKRLVSSIDLQAVVQSVIDGGRELTGASFGAFIVPLSNNSNVRHASAYSARSSGNEDYLAMPGVHELLAATIEGNEVIRLDDVRSDVRYSNINPHTDTAGKDSAVVSYLAAPVRSRNSHVLGGLLFAHHQPGYFTADHERLLLGLAAQAAIAIDNNHLFHAESMARHIATQRSEDLARTNAELQQFAFVISHDLQEPLRTVTQYLDLLRRRHGFNLNSQAQRYIDYASENATRMYSLLNDLLTYSRIGRDAEREPVSLQDVFDEVCDDLGVRIAEARAKVICGELPTVYCERSKIRLVMQNLLANALKFRGNVDPRCLVSAERDRSGTWIITVADNGIGISPDHHAIIFEVFEQLHDRENFPGTGIGLAICRKVMEQHGGRIWVESTPGAGSAFRFSLPEIGSHPRSEIHIKPLDIPEFSPLFGGER